MNLTRLRTFAARASLPRPDAPVLGRTQNFYRVLGEKFCGLFIYPGQSVRQVVYQPPATGTQTGVYTRQAMSRDPPQRRRARARSGVAPYIPAAFCRDAGGAGHGATRVARPERSLQTRGFHASDRDSPRSRVSGFGGDWQVRQQLPVGVRPDDRMPPGSREPKVRPADRTTPWE